MISKKGYEILKLIKQGKYEDALKLDGESQTIEYFINEKYIVVFGDLRCVLLARGEQELENYRDIKIKVWCSFIFSIISLAVSIFAIFF